MSFQSHSQYPDPGQYADQWAYEYPKSHPHHHHAAPAQRSGQNSHGHRRRGGGNSADYTLMHGRRQVRLGPVAFWIVVGSLVVMAGWSVLTGTYFAFHDDVLKRLIARQAEMQYAYEDRIAELRAQVDRIASRQLLDQEQFEQKLEALIRKQATLEQRAATLGSLPDPVVTGSIPKPQRSGDAGKAQQLKPSPINDTASSERQSRLVPLFNLRKSAKTRGSVEGTLARVQESLDRMEAHQAHVLNMLEESFEARARRVRTVLSELGLNPGKAAVPPPSSAVGGPFVPANLASEDKTFERQLYRIHVSRSQLDRLNRTLLDIPVRKPVSGDLDASSSFGVRMDPFLRSPAMHTGLDLRGDTGDPVRVTANGTVTFAGTNGGYGKMVEVQHKSGLATRYAHLSSIEVKVGQSVKVGQIVGRLGSTGRSTGPHLHYETRVDGEAVDPLKYLRAGIKLGLN